MNAENEDDFLHRLATSAKTQIWLNGTQLLLLRTSCRFTSTLWWLLQVLFKMILHAPSRKTIFAVLDVRLIWLLISQCSKLFYYIPEWRKAGDWGTRWYSTSDDSSQSAACRSTGPSRRAIPSSVSAAPGRECSTSGRRPTRRTRRRSRHAKSQIPLR